MSELLWRVQLKGRFLTISVRRNGEKQSFQLHFLFIYWVNEGRKRSKELMCAKNGPSAVTCWISLSPTAVLGRAYNPIFSREMRNRRPKRCAQGHQVLRNRLAFEPNSGLRTHCIFPSTRSPENTNGLYIFYLFPSPAQIKHQFPDLSFTERGRTEQKIIPCFHIDPFPESGPPLQTYPSKFPESFLHIQNLRTEGDIGNDVICLNFLCYLLGNFWCFMSFCSFL